MRRPCLGILGGMSWHSTAMYYETINRNYSKLAPSQSNPHLILDSLVFSDLLAMFKDKSIEQFLLKRGRILERSGADLLVIASNTVHYCYDYLTKALNLEILHIADAIANHAEKLGIKKALLLGTCYTMQMDFYIDRLQNQAQLQVIIPEYQQIKEIDQIISNELTRGVIRASSAQVYQDIIAKHADEGAQAVILACTEIGLLIKQADIDIPLIDSTIVHCDAAVAWLQKTCITN